MNKPITDELLVELYKKGDQSAFEVLAKRYEKLIYSFADKYYIEGGDFDDVVQEGLLGLDTAISTFDPQKSKFGTFAYVCIKGSILNAVKRANSLKNSPLNTSLPITDSRVDDERPFVSPENSAIITENLIELVESIKSVLSDFEKQVFNLYFMQNLGYTQIAETLGVLPKSVDNAICRIKDKVKKIKE